MSVLSNLFRDVSFDAAEFGVWSAKETPIAVRYARSVLESIRVEAIDCSLSIPRGGLEIGGVLFGSIDGTSVTILARRQFTPEYLTGPGFVLSPLDEEKLATLLHTYALDPELEGMQPVGWYHSHTRSDIFLSAEDIAVHERFFDEPQQVALVVRPVKFKPTRAGFFVREADGSIRGEATYCEFVLEEDLGAAALESRHTAEQTAPSVPVDIAPVHLESIAVETRRPPFLGWRYLSFAAAAIVVIAALLTAYLWKSSTPPAAADARVDLRLTGAGDDILIAWNQASKEVRESSRGVLEIFDGAAEVVLPLDETFLKRGSVTYARLSETVEVRLRLFREQSIVNESIAHYVKPLAAASTHQEKPAEPAPIVPVSVPDREPVTAQKQEEPIRAVESVRRARLPTGRSPRPLSSPELVRALPEIDIASQVAASNNSYPPVPSSQITIPRPPVPPAKQLASGRAIWTGQLRRGGVLMVDAGRASSGTLSGRIPTGPVRIAARPAELIDGGMIIYTNSPHPSEPPSARNGWNATMYENDARRLNEIGILESPSADNNWRLVVRGEGRTIGVIVLDWQELAQ